MQLLAPAKLTVSLRMTGLRDDGYHLIDAEMVSLDLADVLTLDLAVAPSIVSYTGAYPVDVEPGLDLVSQALTHVRRSAAVVVDKRIPAGGGLGGGSSDAAAILRWAGEADLAAAANLGADVAFCLVGGRARVQGIGEVVTSLAFEERTYTLLVPPFGCSTPAVYAKWDELGGPTGLNGNDLEPAALNVEPRLRDWRDRLGDATGVTPKLAGSGATWFVEGDFPGGDRLVTTTIAPLG
jgi:4-diphosphocytidyl-2-C-methyl-D-erythritol kinase